MIAACGSRGVTRFPHRACHYVSSVSHFRLERCGNLGILRGEYCSQVEYQLALLNPAENQRRLRLELGDKRLGIHVAWCKRQAE